MKVGIKTSEILSVQLIVESLKTQGYSLAIFQMPTTSKINIVASKKAQIIDGQVNVEKSKGFVFAPFIDQNQSSFIIKPDLHLIASFDHEQKIVIVENKYGIEIESLLIPLVARKDLPSITIPQINSEEKIEFVQKVDQVKSKIEKGEVEKVVLARSKSYELSPEFNYFDFFKRLCAIYPSCFVSCFYTPATGIWIGSSPETLISIDNNTSIFKTMSLAGTKYCIENTHPSQISWTQKEIEEQALVSRYIINCFKKIRVREFEEHGPKTVQFGNLFHLRTIFSVNMKEVAFEELGTVMLQLLHPTSAVCGMPKDSALNILKEIEVFDRQYYSGYLGPINMATEYDSTPNLITHLFVNIRCMKLEDNKAVLFAGAGLTIDSIAENEFEETERKFEVLSSYLMAENKN